MVKNKTWAYWERKKNEIRMGKKGVKVLKFGKRTTVKQCLFTIKKWVIVFEPY